jgi:manganese transport protein
VKEIEQAYELLSPLLGLGIALALFAVALLAAGMNSSVTATLAGQIVMEGFLRLRLPNWARRLLTRGIAIVPVVVVTAVYGERGTGHLLIFSQVILSMQLPFAVMGQFTLPRSMAILAWVVAGIILTLNIKLLFGCPLSLCAQSRGRPCSFGRPYAIRFSHS